MRLACLTLSLLLGTAPSAGLPGLRVRPGEWVVYRAVSGARPPFFLRLAAVGDEPSSDGTWLEVEAGLGPELRAPLVQLKLLYQRQGAALSGRVLRAVAVVGHGGPRELEPARWRIEDAIGAGPTPPGAHSRWGAIRVLSLAGRALRARPWETVHQGVVVQRLWVSDEVPVLNLVRMEVPALNQTLELDGFGFDARARIPLPSVETPEAAR